MARSLAPLLSLFLVAGLLPAAGMVRADELAAEMAPLVSAWDAARFVAPRWERTEALRRVAGLAAEIASRYPDAAGPLAVRGGALAEVAIGTGGTPGAADAREARALLKAALAREPAVLNGAAHASLGLLYHKMPPSPLGVGSARRAEKQFRQALAINPRGVEPNYLYADFLADEGRPDEARRHVDRALAAPPDPAGRRVADEALAAAARELLAELKADE